MYNTADNGNNALPSAEDLQPQYLAQALSGLSTPELKDLQGDINALQYQGVWSKRIIDLMARAKCIADADGILARFEAAA